MSLHDDIITNRDGLSIDNTTLSPTNDIYHDKMSLLMDMDFSDWLIDELKKRGWSQADLAKAAGINRQIISTYINRQRQKPDSDILITIARALRLPPESVFRAAGILPSLPEQTSEEEELLYLFRTLPDKEKRSLLRFIRATLNALDN